MQLNICEHKLIRCNKGFTILEMMIAMVIGLGLVTALFNFLLTGVQTYAVQSAVSEIQDESRIVFDLMTSHIRMAGYQESDIGAGRLSDGMVGIEGANSTPDTITLKSQSGPIDEISAPLVDCAGNSYPDTTGPTTGLTTMTNTFTVTANQLRCTTGIGTTVTLANNVEDLQLLYGVDTTSDGVPNQYLDANSATMTDAISVSICLILRSADNAVSVVSPYIDCSGATVTPTDFRLRETLQLVANLRN